MIAYSRTRKRPYGSNKLKSRADESNKRSDRSIRRWLRSIRSIDFAGFFLSRYCRCRRSRFTVDHEDGIFVGRVASYPSTCVCQASIALSSIAARSAKSTTTIFIGIGVPIKFYQVNPSILDISGFNDPISYKKSMLLQLDACKWCRALSRKDICLELPTEYLTETSNSIAINDARNLTQAKDPIAGLHPSDAIDNNKRGERSRRRSNNKNAITEAGNLSKLHEFIATVLSTETSTLASHI